jgi:hypothetical protein
VRYVSIIHIPQCVSARSTRPFSFLPELC